MRRPRRSLDRVTIQEVATRAGVSVMTVSNVTNRLPIVREETRARVLAAISELGYVPSQTARRLNGATASRVGVIYFDGDFALIDTAIATISVAAAKRGLQLIMNHIGRATLHDLTADMISDMIASLVRSGAEGVLLLAPLAELVAGSVEEAKIKVPLVSIETATALPHVGTFRIDNRAAARAMTEYLIARGRRRIAVITGPMNMAQSLERYAGHCDAMQAGGLEASPELRAEGQFTFQSGLAAAERLLSLPERPDAIVAANDDMAAAVLLAAHRLRLDLPRELAVTGFDDTLLATRVWPSLTTVRQPSREMVERALDHLTDVIRRRVPAELDVVLDFEVIERNST